MLRLALVCRQATASRARQAASAASLLSRPRCCCWFSSSPPASSSGASGSAGSAGGTAVAAGDGRGAERRPIEMRVGESAHGFRLLRRTPVQHFNLTVFEMEHERTGASYIHMDCSDTNNTFCVALRTPSSDNTGVPHVLEHTALCGSQQYPVRDPFFHMMRRSLNTFMNAMTGSEYTMYPFSTQNKADYENLLRVYVDAVFYPLLSEMDFKQEGHRLEYEVPDDPSSPMCYRGIVYNEMKGAMSDSGSILYHKLHESMFPDTTYRFNSGGEPSAIPSLTHSQLVEFHKTHYRASNSRFFSYGDLPPPLQLIEELVMPRQPSKSDDRSSINTEVPLQGAWEPALPKRVEFTAPPDAMIADRSKQTTVQVGFLLPDFPSRSRDDEDAVTCTAISLLSPLLLGGADSPFHRSLVAPNIGSGLAPNCGLHPTRQPVFAVGLEGVAESDVDRVPEIIDATLKKCVEEGFEEDKIQAIFHQHELSQKRVRSNFGLSLLGRILPLWMHSGDVNSIFEIDAHLREIRDRMKKAPYLQELLDKHFCQNKQRCVLVMRPSPTYMTSLAAQERKQLEATDAPPSSVILRDTEQLQKQQKMEQDASVLPSLRRSDISPSFPTVHIKHSSRSGVPLQTSAQATNSLVYLKCISNSKLLSPRSQQLLPLYTTLVPSLGTEHSSYEEVSLQRRLHSGHISLGSCVFSLCDDMHSGKEIIALSASALSRNFPETLNLIYDMYSRPRFDETDRVQQLVMDSCAASSNALANDGHAFALSYAKASFSTTFAALERSSGLTSAILLSSLAQRVVEDDKTLSRLISALAQVAEELRELGIHRTSLIAEERHLQKASDTLQERLLSNIGVGSERVSERGPDKHCTVDWGRKVFFAAPIDVNHVVLALPTVPYAHKDSPKLRVLAKVLSTRYLHREIREKGGAYGGGASWSSNGAFSFYSYRDPECEATLDAYHGSVEWLLGKSSPSISEEDIEQALLSIFSGLDSPVHPSAKGSELFVYGLTEEVRQQHREGLLQCTVEDVVEVAQRYLGPALADGTATVAVVGNQQKLPSITTDEQWIVRNTSELSLPMPFETDASNADILRS